MKEFTKEQFDSIDTGRKVSKYAEPACKAIDAFIESGYRIAELTAEDFGLQDLSDSKEKNGIMGQLRAKLCSPKYQEHKLCVKSKAKRIFIGKQADLEEASWRW